MLCRALEDPGEHGPLIKIIQQQVVVDAFRALIKRERELALMRIGARDRPTDEKGRKRFETLVTDMATLSEFEAFLSVVEESIPKEEN